MFHIKKSKKSQSKQKLQITGKIYPPTNQHVPAL